MFLFGKWGLLFKRSMRPALGQRPINSSFSDCSSRTSDSAVFKRRPRSVSPAVVAATTRHGLGLIRLTGGFGVRDTGGILQHPTAPVDSLTRARVVELEREVEHISQIFEKRLADEKSRVLAQTECCHRIEIYRLQLSEFCRFERCFREYLTSTLQTRQRQQKFLVELHDAQWSTRLSIMNEESEARGLIWIPHQSRVSNRFECDRLLRAQRELEVAHRLEIKTLLQQLSRREADVQALRLASRARTGDTDPPRPSAIDQLLGKRFHPEPIRVEVRSESVSREEHEVTVQELKAAQHAVAHAQRDRDEMALRVEKLLERLIHLEAPQKEDSTSRSPEPRQEVPVPQQSKLPSPFLFRTLQFEPR